MRHRLICKLFACLMPLLGAALACGTAAAQTAPKSGLLKIASAFDPQTLDPHALALLYHSRVTYQVYESLIHRDAQFKLEPALALSWQNTAPLVWRFRLRPGVRFHDGTPFTADDAVFSIERDLAPNSQRAFQITGVTGARKIDPLTIELLLDKPDAVLPEKLQYVSMMSKAWCEAHGVTLPQNFSGKQETFAVRNANGTGPYRVLRFEPDVRTVLERHKDWWGWADARNNGNVQQVEFVTIRSDATRLAALTSGEVDLLLDPPFQDIARLQADPRIRLLRTTDIGAQYLALDQARDELPGSDVKGKNPFKDRRVRAAVYHAINAPLIADKVLRGQAVPTGALLSSRVDGSPPELDVRLPYDPARAKALLAEAGYPNGFTLAMDCVNITWREAVCQAVASMLAQVGIKASLRSVPTGPFFSKLTTGTISLAEFGWSPTPDAWFSLNGLLHSHSPNGQGTFNGGRYSNPKLDALIDNIRSEPDLLRRRAMVTTVLRMAGDDLPLLPLFRRTLTWTMSKRVTATQWPTDIIELRWVRIN
jgi:peptide/nickel transport system substrate-binding protein